MIISMFIKILTITRFVELKRIINKMLKINKEG
jgi:hypothetical protein